MITKMKHIVTYSIAFVVTLLMLTMLGVTSIEAQTPGGGGSTTSSFPTVELAYGENIENKDIKRQFEKLGRLETFFGEYQIYPTAAASQVERNGVKYWSQEMRVKFNDVALKDGLLQEPDTTLLAIYDAKTQQFVFEDQWLQEIFFGPYAPEEEHAKMLALGKPLTFPIFRRTGYTEFMILQQFEHGYTTYTIEYFKAYIDGNLTYLPTQYVPQIHEEDFLIQDGIAPYYAEVFLYKHIEDNFIYTSTLPLTSLGHTVVEYVTDKDGMTHAYMLNSEIGVVFFVHGAVLDAVSEDQFEKLGNPREDTAMYQATTDPETGEALYSYSQLFEHGYAQFNPKTDTEWDITIWPHWDFAEHEIVQESIGPYITPSVGESGVLFMRIKFPDFDYTNSQTDKFYEQAFNDTENISFHTYFKTHSHNKLLTRTFVESVFTEKTYLEYHTEAAARKFGISVDEVTLDHLSQVQASEINGYIIIDLTKRNDINWGIADLNGPDGTPDGYVDQAFFVFDYSGEILYPETTVLVGNKRAYASTLSGEEVTGVNGETMRIGPYSATYLPINGLGVFVHEYFHCLGLTDLYDHDGSSVGTGEYSIMSIAHPRFEGINEPFFKNENMPPSPEGYSKIVLGWAEVKEVHGTEHLTIAPSQDSNIVYKIGTGKEYFLIENRKKTGFDVSLRSEGLAVYHVNENMEYASNDDEWFPLIHLIPSDGFYPWYAQPLYTSKSAPLLPAPEGIRAPLSADNPNVRDTNYLDGSPSGIRIENIDTDSAYPNIKVTVTYPGENNEYASMIDGQIIEPGEGDIDNNGLINEDDHSAFLKLAQDATKTLKELLQIYLGLQYALYDSIKPYIPAVSPLVVDIETIATSHSSITLGITSNHKSRYSVTISNTDTGEEETIVEEEYHKGVFELPLLFLDEGTTYEITTIGETPWGDIFTTETLIATTKILPRINGVLRTKLFSVNIDESLLPLVPDFDSCAKALDVYFDDNHPIRRFVGTFVTEDSTIIQLSIEEEEIEPLFLEDEHTLYLPFSSFLQLCQGEYLPFEEHSELINAMVTSQGVKQRVPSNLYEGFLHAITLKSYPDNATILFRNEERSLFDLIYIQFGQLYYELPDDASETDITTAFFLNHFSTLSNYIERFLYLYIDPTMTEDEEKWNMLVQFTYDTRTDLIPLFERMGMTITLEDRALVTQVLKQRNANSAYQPRPGDGAPTYDIANAFALAVSESFIDGNVQISDPVVWSKNMYYQQWTGERPDQFEPFLFRYFAVYNPRLKTVHIISEGVVLEDALAAGYKLDEMVANMTMTSFNDYTLYFDDYKAMYDLKSRTWTEVPNP